MKKPLTVAVIFLFLGLAFAPGITATIYPSKITTMTPKSRNLNNDLVEITVQICRVNGVENRTAMLTQQQVNELDVLIDNFKTDLNTAETLEESIPIYHGMVESLYDLGLLSDGLDMKKVKALVSRGCYQVKSSEFGNGYPNIKKSNRNSVIYENFLKNRNIDYREQSNITRNSLCLISGETTRTFFITYLTYFFLILYEISAFAYPLFLAFGEVLHLKFLERIGNFFGKLIVLSWELLNSHGEYSNAKQNIIPRSNIDFCPSRGWISSIGLNGKKFVNGTIWGQIPFYDSFCLGVIGFTGIKFNLDLDSYKHYYLGSAGCGTEKVNSYSSTIIT